MRVTLLGAAGGEVTGSAYLVETASARVLVDFGVFQGSREMEKLNLLPAAVAVPSLDAVIVTHGHLDHTGRLPLLAKAGYRGPIYATKATIELTALILSDSAKIALHDTERENRHRERAGKRPLEPIYVQEHVDAIMKNFKRAKYQNVIVVADGIEVTFVEAGHILGSSSVQLTIREGEKTKRVVFSGDIGPKGAPILRDAEPFAQADVVFLESTYGDRNHRPFDATIREFFDIIEESSASDGKILVPTFAIGRAQLLSLLLAWAFEQRNLTPFPVYLDSPMAIEAAEIYSRHVDLFDDDMLAYLKRGKVSKAWANTRAVITADQSKALNNVMGPCMILAGSGMCNGGRILHHLRHNLWKRETRVLIVGYQSEGSVGRLLVDGAKSVKIYGEKVIVKAKVHTLGGFSAHAGQTELLAWLGSMAASKPAVYLVHGEDRARKPFAKLIQERYGIRAKFPKLDEVIEL
jgi:metallo-beta-lactamase family protein